MVDDRYRVLTLDRLITVAGQAGRRVRLLVETKHPTRYGPAVERALVTLLRHRGLLGGGDGPVAVTAMSFSPRALRTLRALAPNLPTVLLLDRIPRGLPLARLPFGARIAGPGLALVRSRPTLVRRLRERGYPVFVWTVNEPDDVDLMVKLGVDGIITDRPAEVRTQLDCHR
jgi:glycerophosphoryl diester phosphodiesterase